MKTIVIQFKKVVFSSLNSRYIECGYTWRSLDMFLFLATSCVKIMRGGAASAFCSCKEKESGRSERGREGGSPRRREPLAKVFSTAAAAADVKLAPSSGIHYMLSRCTSNASC